VLRALLAEHAGRLDDAARDYADAAKGWHTGRSPHEEGLAVLGLARCLLQLRRGEEARAALSHAGELLKHVGSRPALAELDCVRQTAKL
jgi:hypothetical protein